MSDYSVLSYGDDISINVADIPEASKYALMRQAFGHKLGNEAASAVQNRIEAFVKGDAKSLPADFDIKHFREVNRELVDQWAVEARAGIVSKIMSGTLGVREGGPRLDPVEAEVRSLAVGELTAAMPKVFKRNGKNDEEIQFPNGALNGGQPWTRGSLLAAYVAKHGERLRPEAAKIVRAKKAAAEKGVKAAASGLEDLGL